jgi:hypothetical protein
MIFRLGNWVIRQKVSHIEQFHFGRDATIRMAWVDASKMERTVPRFQPSTNTSIAIAVACPECPRCGTQMMLARIMPGSLGHELRTFECPMCEHSEGALVKFE